MRKKRGGTNKIVKEEDWEMLNGDRMPCGLGGLQCSGEMSITLGGPNTVLKWGYPWGNPIQYWIEGTHGGPNTLFIWKYPGGDPIQWWNENTSGGTQSNDEMKIPLGGPNTVLKWGYPWGTQYSTEIRIPLEGPNTVLKWGYPVLRILQHVPNCFTV